VNVRLRLTLSQGQTSFNVSYGKCAWKILVRIRTTWFTPESRKGCIKTRSTSAAFPSNWNGETQAQAVRMQARTQRCSKEHVTCTSANRLKRSGYRQNSKHFYHSISPYRLFFLKVFIFLYQFLTFWVYSAPYTLKKSPVFVPLSVNIL